MVLAVTAASAQPGLSVKNRVALQQFKMNQAGSPFSTKASRINKVKGKLGIPRKDVLAITRLADGVTEADLRAEGINVIRCSYGFAFISTPVEDAERICSLNMFKDIQFEKPVKAKMVYAREVIGASQLHQGIGLTQAYTGKGVVCGIVDNGFDVNHVNFLDDEGNHRVKYFETIGLKADAQGNYDLDIKYVQTPKEMAEVTTDNEKSYHGTHTMGIMAGSYRGNARVATLEQAASGKLDAKVYESAPNPYYGIAYEADIVAAAPLDMVDVELAQGVLDMAAYAGYSGKPVVINLSMGSSQGPHDGSDVICQVFDKIAKELNGKIVVASGNEGDMKLAINKTFTADDKVMQSFIEGATVEMDEGKTYMRFGSLEFYSNDKTPPAEVQIIIYNKSRKAISGRFSMSLTEVPKQTAKYWCSPGYEEYTGVKADQKFSKYFEGYLGIGWDIDPGSGRAYAILDIATIDNMLNNKDSNYILGFKITGADGQRIDGFAMGDVIYGIDNFGIDGYDDGTCNGTVSNESTAKSVLCVGSITSCNVWPQLDGSAYSQLENGQPIETAGKVSSFTSYGTLVDGRNLPHVLAPGAYVISSMNRYYFGGADLSQYEDLLTAKALTPNNDPFGWSLGTSMACPVVTGTIALWLEANPELTMDEIKDIIATTAIKTDDMVLDDPVQVGYGMIDAYEGLKEVLRRKGSSGVKNVTSEDNRLVVTPDGDRRVKVFVAGESELKIEVFDVAGVNVVEKTVAGDEALIDLSGNAKGAYVIKVNGRLSKCVLIK